MVKRLLLLCAAGLLVGTANVAALHAQSLPDVGGTYRCVPDISTCQSATFSVSQSGSQLTVKGEHGEVGTGQLTSPVTVSLGAPWNVLGTLLPDQRTIEWSAGTRWQKQ